MNAQRFLLALMGFALLAGCATTPDTVSSRRDTAAATSAAAPPKSVLWVGNSFFYYNNSMHGHVGNLISNSGVTDRTGYRGVSATISGSGLNWHDVEAHFKPGGVGSYSFDRNNNVVFSKGADGDRPFDAVLMMDCSQCPIHPQLRPLFYDAVKKNAEIVRRHGARPVLFMSWAYSDKPEMTEQLAAEYDQRHLVATAASGAIVGYLNLTPLDAQTVKMRQVAVSPEAQGQGIGTALVRFSEALAAQQGFHEMVLHARETAVPFYLRLGYEQVGERFEEVGIPHFKMRKQLT